MNGRQGNRKERDGKRRLKMEKALEKALEQLRIAMGNGVVEHEGWAVLRGDNRPVNGCYEAKGYYKPKAK